MGAISFVMPGRYQAYPEYKDSGVEWIGDLPSHWSLVRGKFKFVNKKVVNKGLQCMERLALTMKGVVDRSIESDDGLQPAEFSGYQIFEKDDLVFKLIDLENLKTSRVGLVHKKGIMSPAYIRATPNKGVYPRYFYYFYFDLYLRGIYNEIGGQGVRSALNASDLLNILICSPALTEQEEIANFLDHETAKIDALIEKQQQLIALLKEKRQAVISHAVTKGLNPDAPMKDSGIEWLGKVPAHWDVAKVKCFASIQGGYAFSSDSFQETGVQLLRIGNVYLNRLALERQPVFVDESFEKSHEDFTVRRGDILMSLTGTLGKRDYGFAVQVNEDGPFMLNQRVAKITPIESKVAPEYLIFSIRSESYLKQLYSLPSGTKQANLSNDDVTNIPIVVPPTIEEQLLVARYIREKLDRFDCLIEKSEAAIALTLERRTALISAAVTGKIDVRHHASRPVGERSPSKSSIHGDL